MLGHSARTVIAACDPSPCSVEQAVNWLSPLQIRNPAHVISRGCEFVREELALPAGHPVLEDLDTIQHAADTMHRLITGAAPAGC